MIKQIVFILQEIDLYIACYVHEKKHKYFLYFNTHYTTLNLFFNQDL